MTEREQFEKWLGEETCEVHCDESANKNAWYGWQAGRQQGLEQIEQVERMADDLAAEIYIQGGSSSLYWQSREVADAIRKLKEQG